MKRLKLKALELGAKEVLTRAQLKNVFGGDEGSGGTAVCKTTACSGYDPIKKITYSGTCTTTISVPNTGCECKEADGDRFYHADCAY